MNKKKLYILELSTYNAMYWGTEMEFAVTAKINQVLN